MKSIGLLSTINSRGTPMYISFIIGDSFTISKTQTHESIEAIFEMPDIRRKALFSVVCQQALKLFLGYPCTDIHTPKGWAPHIAAMVDFRPNNYRSDRLNKFIDDLLRFCSRKLL